MKVQKIAKNVCTATWEIVQYCNVSWLWHQLISEALEGSLSWVVQPRHTPTLVM